MNTADSSGKKSKARSMPPTKSSPSTKAKPSSTRSRKKGPQPYTPYTIYFRLERLRILQSQQGFSPPPSYDPSHYDPNEHPRPSKYAGTKLPPFWYSSASRAVEEKKRKHRKLSSNGLSKEELTGMISRSWKNVDPEVYVYCKRLSEGEKTRVAQAQKAQRETDITRTDDILVLKNPTIASNSVQDVKAPFVPLSYTPSTDQMRAPLKKRPIHFISTDNSTNANYMHQNDYTENFATLTHNPLPHGSEKAEDGDGASVSGPMVDATNDNSASENTTTRNEPDVSTESTSVSSLKANTPTDNKVESSAFAPILINRTSQAPSQPRTNRSPSIGIFSYEKIQVEHRQVKYGRLVSIVGRIDTR